MEWIRLSVDSGFFVLIWLVQVIIYPSFRYIDKEKLYHWHGLYTRKILYFVGPMLFIQTGVIALQILFEPLLFLVDGLILAGIWINTFFIAVPVHGELDRGANPKETVEKLLRVNRWRALGWTALFIFSLVRAFVS